MIRKEKLINEKIIVRDFSPDDWQDLIEVARSNAESGFAFCDEQWPTDEKSVREMCEYMATDKSMSAIYARDIEKVVCFVNFNGIDKDKWLDIGHVMNRAYAGRGYEYEGLKMLCEAGFEQLDIVGIRAYWALDDAVKLDPLLKLGMQIVGTFENSFFGGKEGTFTGCELKMSKLKYYSAREDLSLFAGETLSDVLFYKEVRFDVVFREEMLWCGTLGYAADLTAEPDIGGLLHKYQLLASVEKKVLVCPAWSGCISIDYQPGGKAPRGIIFMQQVNTETQDERYDVLKTSASAYIRVCYGSALISRKLLGKNECDVYEMFDAIHEVMEQNNYVFSDAPVIEIEYYGKTSCYAYCAVKKKES